MDRRNCKRVRRTPATQYSSAPHPHFPRSVRQQPLCLFAPGFPKPPRLTQGRLSFLDHPRRNPNANPKHGVVQPAADGHVDSCRHDFTRQRQMALVQRMGFWDTT
ncbi:hypothetical protein VDGE_30560 [Verticillium dahliae]|uniref:Uncharacterized protein n=1 Tax=Verticillium dahliae TaxID=27337 RepID=A0A444S8H2_VERDA|nr:hypothetical protein VDGE_30560 [Verticillium dahliae]